MGVSNIWRLRKQPTILSRFGKLLWWAMVPLRLAKSLGLDILRRRFANRFIAFVPGTMSLSDGLLAVRLALDTRSLIEGPHIAQYEQAFADYLGVERAVSFGAGRVALNAILRAMDIGPGDEVILPAYTCVVVPNAILYTGARPVFADIDAETYNLTAETVTPKITDRSRAILVQHTFGLPADLEPLLQLARRHDLAVIEDCAAALGASYKGRQVGTWGDAAFFSTEHSKIISTEVGGTAIASSRTILDRLIAIQAKYAYPTVEQVRRLLTQFASTAILLSPTTRRWGHMAHTLCAEWFDFKPSTSDLECRCEFPDGYYVRLSNAQARLGLRQLDALDQNLATRRAIAHTYQKALSQLSFRAPRIVDGATPAFARYPFCVFNRDELVRFGAEHDREIGIWFASVAHPPSSSLDRLGYRVGSCPVAENAARCTANLPTHPMLAQEDVDRILDLLSRFSRNASTVTARRTGFE